MKHDLLYLGLTYRTAPLSVREAVRPDDQGVREMLHRLEDLAAGRIVLTTCERFELYGCTDCPATHSWIMRLADWFHVPTDLLTRHLQVVRGTDVAAHLLRVAAGLESRVLGEPQILGQVRDAYLAATREQSLDPVLSALCRAAIRTGKRVRHETNLNRSGRSIATLAVDRLAARHCARVTVVGSGRLARDVIEEWAHRHLGRITLVARNLDGALRIANAFPSRVTPETKLRDALRVSDAVVTCTASPRFILDAGCLARRARTPMVLIDLSMPRNIDPDVRLVPNVTLHDLDQLLSLEGGHPADASASVSIVREELERFSAWRRGRAVAPIIESLCRCAGHGHGGQVLPDRRALHEQILRVKESAGV